MSAKKIQRKHSSKVLGEIKEYVKDPLGFLQKNQQELGDAFGFRLAHRTIYFVNQPTYIHHILQGNHRNYKKSIAYKKLGLMLGNGLFTSEGEFWLRQRRLAQPAFHKKKIEGYFNVFKKHVSLFVAANYKKGNFQLGSEMTRLTLGIITEALLGLAPSDKSNLIEQRLPGAMRFLIRRITSSVNAPLWFPTKDNKVFTQSSRMLRSLIADMIVEKRRDLSGEDLLTQLIAAKDEDSGEQMSNDQLIDEVLTIFLAGHETTAVSAFWAFYLLDQYPDVHERLIKEVQGLSSDFTLQELSQLTYLDAVIKEVMRYYGPVWVLGREALTNDQLGDFQIKKGDSIIFSPYMMHRHQEYWAHPNKFDPDRFLQGGPVSKNTYFPFGNGPRLCIGNNFAILELKVILAVTLKKMKLHFEDSSFPGYECSLTLRPLQDRQVKGF